jgi:geranylgeranyl diphosphate synthase type II
MADGGAPSDGDLVRDVLAEYGAAMREVLFRYLPAEKPRVWLYDLVADYPRRGGRAMRPSLCIAAARAHGRPLEDAVLTAVSIELMHNAMLIHDDIEDESELRRGKPTLHREHGIPLAMNAGDLLALLSLRPLLDNRRRLGPWLSLRLLEETEEMARASAEGQATELGWRRDNVEGLTERDYLDMVLRKTCWLATIHPLRAGALIGAGSGADLDGFFRLGFFLGAAFQIQDDLLNLEGDPAAYGKEIAGDIWEGKRSLMLIRTQERATPRERARLRRMLAQSRGDRRETDAHWVRRTMDRYGAVEYARRVAQGLAGAAQHEAGRVLAHLPPSRDRAFIEALPRWVIERR